MNDGSLATKQVTLTIRVIADKHARSAVGVAVLPMDAPVEVELIAEVGGTGTGGGSGA